MTLASPCIKLCTLDPTGKLCVGCGRTRSEIARWTSMSQADRLQVMALLPARLAGLAGRGGVLP